MLHGQPGYGLCSGTTGLALMFAGFGRMLCAEMGGMNAAANGAEYIFCWELLSALYTIKQQNMLMCQGRSPGVAELPAAAGALLMSNVTFRELLDGAASCTGLGTLLPSKPAPAENAWGLPSADPRVASPKALVLSGAAGIRPRVLVKFSALPAGTPA